MLPRNPATDLLRLEDKLADFISLGLFLSGDIFPAEDSTTVSAGDVGDSMQAGDELAGDRLMDVDIEQRRGRLGQGSHSGGVA